MTDSDSELNVMTTTYVVKLYITIRKINVKVQKIVDLLPTTYVMVLDKSLLQDSLGKVRFFEKTFLLVDTSMEVVLELSFLSFSNANVKFMDLEKLTWSFYTIAEVLFTISRIDLIGMIEFAKTALNKNLKTFVMFVAALEANKTAEMVIHHLWTTQLATL